MGINNRYLKYPSGFGTMPDPRNPDPNNYQIIDAEEYEDFLIVKVKYPNCVNYEGEKILVYRGITFIDLVNQKVIDPHFFKNKKYSSPIARFVPTVEGWNMAKTFVVAMAKD